MKKLEKLPQNRLTKSISGTKLFLEDIKEIINKMNSKNLEIKITDSENRYDSIPDLIEHRGKNPACIILTGKIKDSPFDFIEIRVTNSASYIHILGNSALISFGYELEGFLKERKRKWYHSFFSSRNAKLNILFFLILIGGSSIYSQFEKVEIAFKVWYGFIAFWGIIFIYSELNPLTNSKIELSKKHDINFYKRNKDKILIGVLMALFGSLVTLVIQNWI